MENCMEPCIKCGYDTDNGIICTTCEIMMERTHQSEIEDFEQNYQCEYCLDDFHNCNCI